MSDGKAETGADLKVSSHYRGDAGQEYFAHRLDFEDRARFEYDAAFFRPYLKPTDTMLDFGAGTGGLLRLLQPEVALAEGLEVNVEAASAARRSGYVIYSNVDEIPDEERYDVIVTNHVLEHVRDACSVVESLRPKLKPGGLLLVKLPLDDWRWSHMRRFDPNDIDRHLATWPPRLFANVLYEAGYDVRECRVVTSSWFPYIDSVVQFMNRIRCRWAVSVMLTALSILKKRRQLFAVGVRPRQQIV